MEHPIETFTLSFDESALSQYRAVQPGGVPLVGYELTPSGRHEWGYRATGPQLPSGLWGITATIFNVGSSTGIGFQILPGSQQMFDSQVVSKMFEFYNQYVKPKLGPNQWVKLVATKAGNPSATIYKCVMGSMIVGCPEDNQRY